MLVLDNFESVADVDLDGMVTLIGELRAAPGDVRIGLGYRGVQRAYAPTRKAYQEGEPTALPLSSSLATTANRREPPDPANRTDGDVPASLPKITHLRDGASTVCAGFAPGAATPRLLVDATPPPADPRSATTGRSPEGTPLADRALVRPG